jgi:hypothetical protein
MIKFNELKKGDFVIANFDGDLKRGEIDDIKAGAKQVSINNGVQSFWFDAGKGNLSPIEVNDNELTNLKFSKIQNEDGSVKYMKGAFRLQIPQANNFAKMEMWYRDERRIINEPIALHSLQNHFYEMTKVHLNDTDFN